MRGNFTGCRSGQSQTPQGPLKGSQGVCVTATLTGGPRAAGFAGRSCAAGTGTPGTPCGCIIRANGYVGRGRNMTETKSTSASQNRKQCQAEAKHRKRQCAHSARDGTDFCRIHQKAQTQQKKPRVCMGVNKDGKTSCKSWANTNGYCASHQHQAAIKEEALKGNVYDFLRKWPAKGNAAVD